MHNIRVLFYTLVILIICFLSTDGQAFFGSSKLSKDEAIKQINETQGYPKYIFKNFLTDHVDGCAKKTILPDIPRLINEGYLTKTKSSTCPSGFYVASEKGKNVVKDACYNGFYNTWRIKIATLQIDVGEVLEILTDSKKGEALVKYSVKYSPTPLYSSYLNKDDCFLVWENPNRNPQVKEAWFKRWDEGWRIQNAKASSHTYRPKKRLDVDQLFTVYSKKNKVNRIVIDYDTQEGPCFFISLKDKEFLNMNNFEDQNNKKLFNLYMKSELCFYAGPGKLRCISDYSYEYNGKIYLNNSHIGFYKKRDKDFSWVDVEWECMMPYKYLKKDYVFFVRDSEKKIFIVKIDHFNYEKGLLKLSYFLMKDNR